MFPQDSLAFALFQSAALVRGVMDGRNFTDLLGALPALPAAVRGAIADLAYGTLRDFGRGDFLTSRLLARPLTEPAVQALLLVALHRLERRPQDAHTIVDQAVTAAGAIRRGAFKALVNGVLRNFGRQREALLAAAEADEVARARHPRWWIEALRAQFPNAAEAVLAAGNSHPPMCLRVNLRKTTREAVLAALEAAGIAARPVGAVGILLARPVPVAQLPGFERGEISVQDLGAQQAAAFLGAQDGMRVLDACAAPGGKTAHILEAADVALTALDQDAARAARVSENLARLELQATVKVSDCRAVSQWWDGKLFDRILADVPCSASGVARRHPDIKWLRRKDDIAKFARQQADILAALWPLLAPGGRLLYATCSVFAEENEAQIARFEAGRGDCLRVSLNGEAAVQLLPCEEHDGFYYALLEKRV